MATVEEEEHGAKRMDRAVAWLAGRNDPERAADGPPPDRMGAFFRWCLRGSWGLILIAAAGFAVGGMFEAVTMYLLGQVIDATTLGPDGFWSTNWGVFAVFLLAFLVGRPLAFAVASAVQAIAVSPNLFSQIMVRLNRHTLGQPVSFFDDDFAGRIAQKQLQTAGAIMGVVQEVINAISFALSAVLGMAVLSGLVDPVLIGVLVVWLAGYFTLLRYFLPKVRARSGAVAGARAAVTGQIVDTVTNIKTVKLFAHDQHEDRAALEAIAGYRGKAIHWARLSVTFRVMLIILAGSLPVLMVGYGLISWQSGGVTSGQLAAVGGMAIRLAQMTGWVSWTLMGIYAALGEVEDGMKTLSPAHDLTDRPGAGTLNLREGAISFKGLGFAYGRQKGGVHGIDLDIAAGEKIGIVGASGAGKSTLVSLLLRLYDAEEGRIEIDGQDVAGVTQVSLRAQVGMVTQDTAMFNRSARDNIRYGRPDANDAEVEAAAAKAEADEFIHDLRDGEGRQGYDAHLGERGVKLSGGQRQRIALARAILKDAPILVLDEATSALDSQIEAAIQGALSRVMEGKTVLAIAHRLSTIAQMDRIVVMDQGRVAEIGSHEELLAAEGIYATLWAHQSGGFIGELAAE